MVGMLRLALVLRPRLLRAHQPVLPASAVVLHLHGVSHHPGATAITPTPTDRDAQAAHGWAGDGGGGGGQVHFDGHQGLLNYSWPEYNSGSRG